MKLEAAAFDPNLTRVSLLHLLTYTHNTVNNSINI